MSGIYNAPFEAYARRHLLGVPPFGGYPFELEEDEADRLTIAGHIVPVSVGSENTYYENAAGFEFYCKNYPHAETWPIEYLTDWQNSDQPTRTR